VGQWARVLTVTQFLVVLAVSSPQQPRDGTDGRRIAPVTEPVFDEPGTVRARAGLVHWSGLAVVVGVLQFHPELTCPGSPS
jgi:hypothetical protein